MNTSTLPTTKTVVMFGAGTGAFAESSGTKRHYERDGRKVLVMENVAVFRSGTFRDSMGRQATYSADDMNMFVTNFNNLRANGTFPDVPVRKGHPQFGISNMDGLIGYITALRTEEREAKVGKQKFTVLLADYEILKAGAQEDIESGLWRNRSAEVGIYTDNNDVDHAPVFMGFGYVDIPAVERLNEFSKADGADNSSFAFSYITEEIMSGSTVPVATPPAPTAPQAPAPVPAAPVEFSIGGSRTTDYAAVQQYISALEQQNANYAQAAAERAQADRAAFVNGLVTENKLGAPQLDGTLAFAKALSDEQFESWKATFAAAPVNPLFQEHGPTGGQTSQTPAAPAKPEDQEYANNVAIVERLSKAGVSPERIKAGASYAKVIAKNPAFQLPAATAIN